MTKLLKLLAIFSFFIFSTLTSDSFAFFGQKAFIESLKPYKADFGTVSANLLNYDVKTGLFKVSVLFKLNPGWHIYGSKTEEVGIPTSFSTEDTTTHLLNVDWPSCPDGKISDSGECEKYEGDLHFDLSGAATKVPLIFSVKYLACGSMCLPEENIITLYPNK